MDNTGQFILNVLTRELAFKLAFESLLREHVVQLGPKSSEELARLRAIYVRDIQNFSPSASIPAASRVFAVQEAVAAIEHAFDNVARQVGS